MRIRLIVGIDPGQGVLGHQPTTQPRLLTLLQSLLTLPTPVFFIHAPSNPPVAENAQQLPHCPRFFTGVTNPLSLWSKEVGAVTSSKYSRTTLGSWGEGMNPSLLSLNSSSVQSECSIKAILYP